MKLEMAIMEALGVIQAGAPYRTGLLKSMVKVRRVDGAYEIYVDEEMLEAVSKYNVNYMPFTNETWTYNKRWGKTLRNPRLYWWNKSVVLALDVIEKRLKGKLSIGE